MSGGKEIKGQISSIKNTQKITKAMEMVAASKMKKAQNRMAAARPYAKMIKNVVGHLASAHPEYKHPFLVKRESVKRVGLIIISSHISNPDISPYFFISLIWYPCFENLFSILRKLNREFSPLKPDSKHLHQLVLFFFTKKFGLKLIPSNNLSSAIICFFNFLIIYISTLNPSSTFFQIKLIAASIIFYNVSYMLLFKFYKSNLMSKKKFNH